MDFGLSHLISSNRFASVNDRMKVDSVIERSSVLQQWKFDFDLILLTFSRNPKFIIVRREIYITSFFLTVPRDAHQVY